MKRGFVLISTLALIVILSFLVLIISRTIYTDTLRTTFYAESMEKRIQIINYESLLVDLLIDNSKEPVKHPLIEEIFSGKKGSSYFKISN